MRFLERYLERKPLLFEKKEVYLEEILTRMKRLQHRQWKSRTKRCLKESTEFSIKREKGVTLYHRRDFPSDLAKRVVEKHLRLAKEKPSGLVKNSPEIGVSLLENGERRICVKQFRYPFFWSRVKEYFRRSKGLRAWVAGNGLRTRGVLVPEPLAFIEMREGPGLKESFFLMEALKTGQELDRYIFMGWGDLREKRLFIQAFAQWLSRFHKLNLYHRDMKACNIVVSKNGEKWDFHPLDLEDVRLDRKVGEEDLFRNLLQLNTSTPKIVTTTDRFRFIKEYTQIHPIVKNRKRFLRRLIEQSKRQGLVYVGPGGTVAEKI